MSRVPALARWATFVRERYEPFSHAVMAGCFALANAGVAAGATAGAPGVGPLAAAVALAFVCFLRLRIFDEVKDHRTDREAHPERPLARGLISPAEALVVAGALALVELVLVAWAGVGAILAWLVVLGYSLAMLAEFGVGAWLRPRLELYAVTHTLVAAWLGIALACLVTGRSPWELPGVVWAFTLVNWAAFNVFEFSRKTFAPEEEREAVPSYSSRLGVEGAAALSLGTALGGLAVAWLALAPRLPGTATPVAVLLAAGGAALAGAYALAPGRRTASAFRGGMIAWTVVLYAAVAASGLVRS